MNEELTLVNNQEEAEQENEMIAGEYLKDTLF